MLEAKYIVRPYSSMQALALCPSTGRLQWLLVVSILVLKSDYILLQGQFPQASFVMLEAEHISETVLFDVGFGFVPKHWPFAVIAGRSNLDIEVRLLLLQGQFPEASFVMLMIILKP